MDEARLEGIVAEVKGHLLDNPPDMGAIFDMMQQLGLPEEVQKRFMDDMKNYFTRLIREILQSINYPASEIDQAVASMAYALGSLSD